MIFFLTLILGIFIGGSICYFYFYKNTEKINNEQLKQERLDLQKSNEEERKRSVYLKSEIESRLQRKAILEEQLRNQELCINSQVEQYKESAHNEYKIVLKDLSKYFTDKINNSKNVLNNIIKEYQTLKNAIESVNKINQEKEEEANQIKFHKIWIEEEELSDIIKLRELSNSFKNKEILNKMIWKSYFEKPTNAMINRVIPNGVVSGIYLLMDLKTNKVYIGQAVDISARWKQHIKRGLGAEPAINNKLYPAMKQNGVENFSFYILETCSREELSKKEKEWINFYKSNIYGLNGNVGG